MTRGVPCRCRLLESRREPSASAAPPVTESPGHHAEPGGAPAPHHARVMPFVAALLQRTLGCPTVEAHQQALQGFLDDLTPWINPDLQEQIDNW